MVARQVSGGFAARDREFARVRESDRRRESRVELRLRAVFAREGQTTAVETQTANVSLRGFYCITAEPFLPGERLTTILSLPSHSGDGARTLQLEYRAKVVRLDPLPGSLGRYGVACQAEEYRVLPGPIWQSR